MKKLYSEIVFIGRFQPVHNAHVEVLRKAHSLADRVIVVLGSAHQPRSVKNPFTADERKHLLEQAWYKIAPITEKHLVIVSVEDNIYNDQAWAVSVQDAVQQYLTKNVGLIGFHKDESSFYLDMFPQWTTINHEQVEPLHAMEVRDHYFIRNSNMKYLSGVLPESSFQFLEQFKEGVAYDYIAGEKEFIDNYKKQYEHYPYPPVFVTSDAVVIQSGNVLMVTRRGRPGKGQLAFPGGFLNAKTDKSMEDCMIRELYEETGLKVPEKIVRGSIQNVKVFDAIERSTRGRTITHAFKIIFKDGEWNLPKVKGGDDAEHAQWVPISQVKRENTFEDHFSILQWALGSTN